MMGRIGGNAYTACMMRFSIRWTVLSLGLLLGSSIAVGQGARTPSLPVQWDSAAAFLRPYGVNNFSPFYKQALRTWLDASKAHGRSDETGSKSLLDDLWLDHPTGYAGWGSLPRQPFGINIGSPTCYYSLRMLSDTVDWRLQSGVQGMNPARQVRFTVVMVGQSHGIEPRNLAELTAGTGIPVTHDFDSRVLAHDHRALWDSVELFEEYVFAMTGGQLGVDTRVLWLPNENMDVAASINQGRKFASLSNTNSVWASVPEATLKETDWWWLIYPSHVPEQYPDFQNAEFVTGGMGTGPIGASPLFICDDRWLVRKPPHIGTGEYSRIERKAYLPQWLQHEFFHHLFRTYPEFGLEQNSHQWFDRSTWPGDFVGRYEADYFHEAMFKRFASASQPLHVALRYATADAPWQNLSIADVTGTYIRMPILNGWHTGTIQQLAGNNLAWTNNAGVSWQLTADLADGKLLTGPDCPYYNPPSGTHFQVELVRDAMGDLTPQVLGFSFDGELYTKQ